MAVIAGIALFVLIIAMFVKYGPPQNPSFSAVWSPIHGLIYRRRGGDRQPGG